MSITSPTPIPIHQFLAATILDLFAEITAPFPDPRWQENITPPASILVTDTNVWISITAPQMLDVGVYTFGIRIAYPTTGAVLLEKEYVSLPDAGELAKEAQLEITDAIAAAEAGAVPGMEPLYLARVKSHRLARESEKHFLAEWRALTETALRAFGINPAIGEWKGDSPTWRYRGARLRHAGECWEHILTVEEDTDEAHDVGAVNLEKPDARALLLTLIERAEESVKNPVPPKPVYICGAFDFPWEITKWMSEQDAEGYDESSVTIGNRVLVIMKLRED